MIKLVIILILMFCMFIASLIVFTRKEEANDNKLKNSKYITTGTISNVERTGKSISKGIMTYTYSVSYMYSVKGKAYQTKTLYEVPSDVLDNFPQTVNVYYDVKKPKNALVKVNLNQSKIKEKETVKSVIPSIMIAILFGLILYNFMIEPLF